MRFSRNIGLISEIQQEKLQNATVSICGTGGMGGVCAEVLVRMGIGHLVLADHDRFERTNINRQIHCNETTIGRNKAEVLAEEFRQINPQLSVVVFRDGVTNENVLDIVSTADVLVNGMDKIPPSLILERTARRLKKTIVDAWLTPFTSVFVMTPASPHWEDYLELPTRGLSIAQLDKKICDQALEKEIDYTFSHGEPYKHIERDLVRRVIRGEQPRPCLAPMIWLSAVLMANEVFKLVVGLPTTDHIGVIYDQYEHKLLLNGNRETKAT